MGLTIFSVIYFPPRNENLKPNISEHEKTCLHDVSGLCFVIHFDKLAEYAKLFLDDTMQMWVDVEDSLKF